MFSNSLMESIEVTGILLCGDGCIRGVRVVVDPGMVTLVDKEWRKSGGLMRGVIVRKLRNSQKVSPVVQLVGAIHAQIHLQHLVQTLRSTIGLRMIAGCIVKVDLERCSQSLEEVRDELRTPIASDVLQNSVLREDVEDKQPY
jgi:hypothetical protein